MNVKKILIVLILVFIPFILNVYATKEDSTSYVSPDMLKKAKRPVVREIKLTVTGDLMVHSWQYNEAYDKDTNEYNFDHNFQDVKKYFTDSDMVIGNLETVFAGSEIGYSDFPMFNSPDSFAVAAKAAGFTFFTTANNHSLDKREAGLLRTLEVLDELGIDHVGTYKDEESRNEIFIKNINGIKIAFLSYTYATNGIPVPNKYNINILDENLIREDIARAKELNPDLIVILPHMGNEYETYVRDVFKDWVDIMFDAGADIVLASHPHVIQPMEFKEVTDVDGNTRTCFVIYSLGNFISSQTTPPRNAGILLNINIEKINRDKPVIKSVSFIPLWTQFRNADDKDHFVVRSVYDMIKLSDEERLQVMRKKDINRVIDIHFETTKMLLGEDVPIEEIKDEYFIYP